MKQKLINTCSLALLAWMGAILMLPIQTVEQPFFSAKASAQQSNLQLSEEQLNRLAKSITVKILSGDNSGSGFLLKRSNQVYTVVTNSHVLASGSAIKIQTEDGKIYPASVVKGVNLQGKDLALLQFRANVNYQVAPLGNLATVAVNEPIYAAGFPFENKSPQSQGFVFKKGKVLLIQERAFKEGYQIGYSNDIEKGMSGGPILNGRGQVIGINGIHAYPLWGNPYVYEDGSRPTAALQDLMSRYSWGIPIQTLARLAPEYAAKESQPAANTASKPRLPPIANEVNNIAQEITVRIDVPTLRECSGSGVIVGKQGNTYTVLTAEHVVRSSRKCDRSLLEVITPDGKQHQIRVNEQNLKTVTDADLAILQFTSNQNYRVATLANYDIVKDKNYIFVSGWLGLQPGRRETQRQFTAGNVVSKQIGSLIAKNSLSLSYGYGLVYTNLTYQGMSGGPILDIRGRVIGIHGKSELEEITDKTGQLRLISLGVSYGVPISSFVRWSQSVGMASIFKVENNQPPKLTIEETKPILEALFQVEKPKDTADAIDWLNYGWELARNTPESLGEKQAKEALRAIDKAIQLDPNFYQAWYLRGFVQLILEENNVAALKSFEQATQIEPKFAPAWRLRGLTLVNLEKLPEALQSFEQLVKLDPNDTSAEIFRIILLLQAERWQEALEVSNRVLQKTPSSWAYFARGGVRIATGDIKGAMADLNQAISLNPEYIEEAAYLLRGGLRAQQGDLKGALADYNEAVRVNPENAENFKNRSAVRSQMQDYKGALADLNEALRLKPEDVDAYYRRGQARAQLKDYQGAVDDYNKVLIYIEKAGIGVKTEINPQTKIPTITQVVQNSPAQKGGVQAGDQILAVDGQSTANMSLEQFTKLIRGQEGTQVTLQINRTGNNTLNTTLTRAKIAPDKEFADIYYHRGLARIQVKDNQGARQDFQTAAALYQQQGKADDYQKVMAQIRQLQ
ncbi:serine protease [Anabaena azotica]|uniref:Trypsin-like peptidase domain-containing protein n=1 Tax=Anabaena azotica FACHB-119 TaxID=947527 RepID=A0ABR8D2N7_9NOST|nr:serine protease [Anabaena azotica]MBD2501390.1 trypsin-like peptidase domain-containing protein [Anabaena azotica FACHB-119]